MFIRVESSHPMPRGTGKGARKYPWLELDIGQSFLFPKFISDGGVSSAVVYASKAYGLKFTVRKTPEGYRCWRIA